MKRIHKILIMILVCFISMQILVFSQESYTAKKTSKPPIIGKGIDDIWSKVQMVPVNKPVEDKDRTIEKNPSTSDYSMQLGMIWDDNGLYFLVKIIDDKLVREVYQDPLSDWHKDDSFNFLISYNFKFGSSSPLEFAWLVTNTTEAKARPRFSFPAEAI